MDIQNMTYTELYQELINNPKTKDFKGALNIRQNELDEDILVWESSILVNLKDMYDMAYDFKYYINTNLVKLGFNLTKPIEDSQSIIIQIVRN